MKRSWCVPFLFAWRWSCVSMALPWLNDLSGKSISLSAAFMGGPQFILLGGLVLLIGLLSGGYPALLMSRFSSNESLKGVFHGNRKEFSEERIGGFFSLPFQLPF